MPSRRSNRPRVPNGFTVSRLSSGRDERNSTRAMMQDHRILSETCRAPSHSDAITRGSWRRALGRSPIVARQRTMIAAVVFSPLITRLAHKTYVNLNVRFRRVS